MKTATKVIAIVIGIGAGFAVGFAWKDLKNGEMPSTKSLQGLAARSGDKVQTPTQLFKSHYSKIIADYVRPIDADELKFAGLSGMMASLGDPHTMFMEPKLSEEFQTDTTGNFVGIGARLEPDPQGAKIVSVFDGGPADRAGLKPADIIIKVNGKSTASLEVDDIVSQIRGVAGTLVKLTISRLGSTKPIDLEIRRARVTTPTVEARVIPDTQTGYLSISSFSEPTAGQFDDGMRKLTTAKINSLVIDLRNNGGGLLDIAVDILSRFVENKIVIKMKGRGGKEEIVKTYSGMKANYNFPIVVLLNGDSASASEIMAGVLRDYQIATLVGEHSYGKASVQNVFPMMDGSSAKITIARYYLPSGTDIGRKVDEEGQYISGGLETDPKVELDTKRGTVLGDIRTDNQLQAALKVLQGQLQKPISMKTPNREFEGQLSPEFNFSTRSCA